MWSELFIMNKDPLLNEMNAFIKEFTEFRNRPRRRRSGLYEREDEDLNLEALTV